MNGDTPAAVSRIPCCSQTSPHGRWILQPLQLMARGRGERRIQGSDRCSQDLDDVTYLKVSKADLDRNVGLTIASRKDAAMERERANRERARRVAALKDLEDGLKDVARQRDLLSQKEDAWQADLRKMAASVEAARAQVMLL